MADIFLSYSHKDQARALVIRDRLREAGWDVWMDVSELHALGSFTEEIAAGIRGCSVFLLLYSRTYFGSPYCGREFSYAAETCGKTLAGLILDEDCPWAASRFGFYFAGMSVPGFGCTADTPEELLALADAVTESAAFLALKSYLAGGGDGPMPPIRFDDRPFLRLRSAFEKAASAAQTYGSRQDYDELLAARFVPDRQRSDAEESEDSERERAGRPEGGQEALPLDALVRESRAARLLLSGSGGLGKTTTLLRYGGALLDRQPVVYVRLAEVRFGQQTGETQLGCIEQYVRRLCVEESTWTYLEQVGRRLSGEGIRATFLLDGLNELPPASAALAEKEIAALARDWPFADLIVTTRNAAPLRQGRLADFDFCRAVAPGEDKVRRFLKARGVTLEAEQARLPELLRNPLRLILFARTQAFDTLCERQPGLKPLLHEEVNTAGNLMDNYLASQLYALLEGCAMDEEKKPQLTAIALAERVLPYLGWRLCAADAVSLPESELQAVFRRPEPALQALLDDFERGRADDLLWDYGYSTDYTWQPREAFSSLFGRLNLMPLVEQPDGSRVYTFPHQSFRDYFAARWLALELSRAAKAPPETLGERVLSEDVVALLSDVLEEERARPFLEPGVGWRFPGKPEDGLAPSALSSAEQALSALRGRDDAAARTAVGNLFEVLRYARADRLARCRFDDLDMRDCRLRGTEFSLWYKDALHVCSFDGAWLELADFSVSGHRAYVTAVCGGADGLLLSGDADGVILETRCADGARTGRSWRLPEAPVRAIAREKTTGQLAAAAPHAVYALDPAGETVTPLGCAEPAWIQCLRFSPGGKLEFSVDTSPAVWQDLDGNRTGAENAPPWRSGAWGFSPDGQRCWRSAMGRKLYAGSLDASGEWTETEDSYIAFYPPREANCIKLHKTLQGLVGPYTDVLARGSVFGNKIDLCRRALTAPVWDTLEPDPEFPRFRELMLESLAPKEPLPDEYLRQERKALLKELRGYLAQYPGNMVGRVAAIAVHPDGDRALAALGNVVAEFDAQLHLLRRAVLRWQVNSLCYLPGGQDGAYAAAGAGMDAAVLDEQFSLLSEHRGAPPVRKRRIINTPDGRHYLFCTDGTLRCLDANGRVVRIRRLRNVGRRLLITEADGTRPRLAFPVDTRRWKCGVLYDYDTDSESPLSDRYHAPPSDRAAMREMHAQQPFSVWFLDRGMRIVPRDDPDAGFDMPYRGGFRIFGCSFRGLRGVSEAEKQILFWNGGEIE